MDFWGLCLDNRFGRGAQLPSLLLPHLAKHPQCRWSCCSRKTEWDQGNSPWFKVRSILSAAQKENVRVTGVSLSTVVLNMYLGISVMSASSTDIVFEAEDMLLNFSGAAPRCWCFRFASSVLSSSSADSCLYGFSSGIVQASQTFLGDWHNFSKRTC